MPGRLGGRKDTGRVDGKGGKKECQKSEKNRGIYAKMLNIPQPKKG